MMNAYFEVGSILLLSCMLLSECSQDSARAENWASLKMQAIELSVKPNVVGMSLIHQWRWDSGSLWKLGTNFN